MAQSRNGAKKMIPHYYTGRTAGALKHSGRDLNPFLYYFSSLRPGVFALNS